MPPTAKGTINWNNVIVVGNGNAVSASGALVIKNSLVTGISGFTGYGQQRRHRRLDLRGRRQHDASRSAPARSTISNNEWRANNRLTFVPDNPSVPFIINFSGSGSAQKLFQGNRVGAGQLGFTGSNWLIGGDTDAAGNVFIGPRSVLNLGGSNSIVRGNFNHHEYSPGMWSQGFNFDFIGAGANVLIEHNFIRDTSWPVQNLVGEFRYNVVYGYGHTWIRTAASGTSIHHNLFVPGGDGEVSDRAPVLPGRDRSHRFTTTRSTAAAAAIGDFAGPVLAMTGGSQVSSLRNNLVTFSTQREQRHPGDSHPGRCVILLVRRLQRVLFARQLQQDQLRLQPAPAPTTSAGPAWWAWPTASSPRLRSRARG